MMMRGMKISVAHSMMLRVSRLETLSHTVRLESGSIDEGMMKGNSAAPAVPITPTIASDEAQKAARVIVPDYQLSLAIGKEGQNARLAARLTGWRIDIRSDADPGPAAPAPGAAV